MISKKPSISKALFDSCSKVNTVKPEITHTRGGCKLLWVITGYGFSQFIYICFIGTGGFKSYGLLEVMGYHSMGYLRFDCMPNQVVPIPEAPPVTYMGQTETATKPK